MSYILNLTNGTELIAGGLSDGFIDQSSTSLTLIGKSYAGYGEFINENFIHLLENFAAGTGPQNPLRGQLWWDTTDNILKVWSGFSWKISTGATSAPFASPPGDLSAIGGDLWFDSTNKQLKVYSGADWVTVGPAATPATGDTGAFPSLMVDTSGGTHVVTQIRITGIPYVIISKDTFTSALSGFAVVKSGINFSTTASPSLVLSTQDINPTASTLVQRDTMGGIFGTTVGGTVGLFSSGVQSPTYTATATNGFNGNLVGNVTATTISATQAVTATSFNASAGYTGTLLTASQPYITTVGNLINLSTNGTTSFTGTATYNGRELVTRDGAYTFGAINNTPIGNSTPSTGAFTSLTASTSIATPSLTANAVIAAFLGNVGTAITGTLNTAVQNNITTASSLVSVGNITTGTWSGSIVQPQYGGTGVNNGTNTLTLTGNFRLNQNTEINSSPTLRGTNFNSIPNGALVNSAVTITPGTGLTGGGTVSLGGNITISLSGTGTVASLTGTANQINVSASTGAVTLSTPQNIDTGANFRVNSLGVSTPASGTAGEIRATNNITAFFSSDAKFKQNIQNIPNALNTVVSIGGKTFDWTDEYIQSHGGEDGYFIQKSDFGVVAQDVQKVFPQAVRTREDGTLAVDYARLSVLAFAAIAELSAKIDQLEKKLT